MLGFFPTPYPDEILYSMMARYKIRSGTLSPKANVGDLFGYPGYRSILAVPTNIAIFLKQLPYEAEYVADDIIFKHTLLPFFAPFLPVERIEKATNAMLFNGGRGIHNTVGVTASTVKSSGFLRFCPHCFVEDERNYGEAYWHRIHQIPGIVICPQHSVLLQNSSAPIHDINPHNYQACTAELCQSKQRNLQYPAKAIQEMQELAEAAQWVMNTQLVSQGLLWLKERYRGALIQKGLATPSGRVFQEKLSADFSGYYSSECLKTAQSPISLDKRNWLNNMVWKAKRAVYPVRHLLFIRYLFGSVEEFFSSQTSYQPFGHSPWICLNAAAEHHLQTVVDTCLITYCHDTKKPVGTFVCDCGFVYSRRGPDVNETDKFKIGRIKEFGPMWHRKLLELHNKGMSFRQIAKALNVDTQTAIKYIRENGQEDLVKKNEACAKSVNDVRTTHREKWMQACSDNPLMVKTQIRKSIKKTYMWLYRHDKSWLNEHSPACTQRKQENKRVDWEARDRFAYDKLKTVALKLLATKGKPIWITRTKLGKLAGVLSWIEKHREKMPISETYLASVTESIIEFQLRKVRWTVGILESQGEELKKWKIERVAGLRREYHEQVKEVILSFLPTEN